MPFALPLRLLACLAALTVPAAAQDYADVRVLDITSMQMMAGPANTAVLLSPDGSRALHIDSSSICLYAPADVGSWAELSCVEQTKENRPGIAFDMTWSPDGASLLMPTFSDMFNRFRDTDVRVVDPDGFVIRNLTPDGPNDSIQKLLDSNFDLNPRWIDAQTIVFVRYRPTTESFGTPVLMTIGADGTGERTIAEIPEGAAGSLHAMAISPDGKTVAYSIYNPKDPAISGIWTIPFDGSAAPTHVVDFTRVIAPAGLAYSADGTRLLLSGANAKGTMELNVLDVATSTLTQLAPGKNLIGAAWSPTGSTLAYIVYDRENKQMPGGLFVTDDPAKTGRLLIGGALFPPVCCGELPFMWASNNTMVLARIGEPGRLDFIRLGQ